MFCSQCGTSVAVSAKFCNSCGSRLADEEIKVEAKNDEAPEPESSFAPSQAIEHAATPLVNPNKLLVTNNKIHSSGWYKSGICLHCGFNGDMAVDSVIAPGHESWKAALIGGILFSVLFLALLSEGVSPIAFLIPLAFFLTAAYLHSQKLECFHCSRCHEISYKADNGTWSREKDARNWYWKSWTDSSLPTYQKIILFALTVCIVGFGRYYLDTHG